MKKERSTTLKDKVALLPPDPGVYRFLNNEGKVIYVGKAKNLKRRVSSYFLASRNRDPKVGVMVRQIADVLHTVVASERDAFLLENNFIKELKPRYNVMLKDDKTYPWIVVRNEPFPRILSTRKLIRDGSRYFGPYSSVYTQRQMLELIRGTHTLRSCSLPLTPERIRQGKFAVCLEYHIGNCKGPCAGHQTEEDYDRSVALAADILKGNTREVIETLQAEMAAAADQMRFEEAQQIKERIHLVRTFESKTVVVNSTLTNLDVFYLLMDEGTAFVHFMRVKRGAIVNSFTVELKLRIDEEPGEILSYAISQIADKVDGGLSHEILVSVMPDAELFPDKSFHVPQRGDKLKLIEFAEKNAKIYRIEKLKQIEKVDPRRHTERIMETMRKDLYMDAQPRHIECFDNSNIQGTHPVASCVVFRDGKPSRKEYRHFNIKTVVGANDFASMAEVVTRRYSRVLEEGGELPDLIVVDGGKGQLSFAYQVLKSLGLEQKIVLIGLAKRLEEVFYPNDPTPHYLDKTSESLKILMHIRDEAHRFGITFHRQKRSNDFIKSELEEIPGLGQKSVEKLLKRFRTLSKIKQASPEELTALIGKSRTDAIRAHFEEAD
ncbi:MAG: excinuclease ABC subunit UvrC [Rikenellaceae bacterium]|jgi:excinuclease ABC subunit C|nr:excinuclease ABC subunit UvrC [Rikenellaceae bacterium]